MKIKSASTNFVNWFLTKTTKVLFKYVCEEEIRNYSSIKFSFVDDVRIS